jgi:hypothetical protein
MTQNFIRLFLIGGVGLLCSSSGFAQCTDAWVSEGINTVMGRPAIGSGNTGECNIYLYGRGSWSSKQDLFNKIAISSSIRMVSAMGGKCIDVEGDGRVSGTRMILWGCADEGAQFFLYRPGYHVIQDHLGSNKCLTIEGGVRKALARIILYTCNNGSNQKWSYLPDGRIMAGNSALEQPTYCMDAEGGTQNLAYWVPYAKQGIILYACGSQVNQKWWMTRQAPGKLPTVNAWQAAPVIPATVVGTMANASIVAAGGGNIVAAGGGNIVAGGGGNIVAGGGGNLINPNTGTDQ